ncbi:FISUMP domain-containing protein [Fibrobacter sp. UWB5]|uniref:FISUMP domain-containing protein n=1 Tax=Fibrobacter sp. UWB5 TaxID=1964360 RepID=UPI0011862F32|nr:FISUMP domain-containing protein [Fibrobacter sp. UWB5]
MKVWWDFYNRRSSVKIFANALALSILLALLAACGDESSSSVSPEPRQCEEQSNDCDNVSSSSEKISKNSSSSQKSADKGKSSSSVEKSKESSSSVKPSSSSEAKSSSSEEVKQSSSSVVASSSSVTSSETVESSSSSYDRTDAFKGTLWRKGEYKTFVDTRDNREYYYIQITGEDTAGKAATIKVMAENLNVGEFVWGSEDQEDDSKIERYCYKNDTANCNKYGGLYQWAEMMQLPSRCNTESCADLIKPNHQGICPSGWRLLTYNDYYIVVHADNNEDGVKGTRSAYGFGGSNDSGYSLIGAGYRSEEGGFARLEDYTIWFYLEEQNSQEHRSSCNGMNPNKTTISSGYQSKVTGASVRCVMVE